MKETRTDDVDIEELSKMLVPSATKGDLPPQGSLLVKQLHLRELRVEAREQDFIFSTDAVDRADEVVEQVWQLERFNSNPVALWAHNSRELPIGHAVNVGVVDGALHGTIRFVDEKANPKAEQVWQSILQGSLRAVSVGFISHSTRIEDDVFILSENELVEISVTPIPMNPEALSRMRARALQNFTPPDKCGGEEKTDMPIDTEELDKLTTEKAALTDELATAKAALDKSKVRIDALETRCVDIESARTEQQERADKLTIELVDRDLDELIGKKISPAEKPGLLKLAALDRELYDSQLEAIKGRADMPHLKRLVVADPTPPNEHRADSDNGKSLAAAISTPFRG